MTTTESLLAAALVAAALASPGVAAALPANHAFGLEGSLDARPGPRIPALTLSAGAWLDGDLEAVARLGFGSAARPEGRGAAAAVLPEVGLRWSPGAGRWRAVAAASLGARLPAAGRATACAGALQVGVERLLLPDLGLEAAVGLRWLAGEGAAAEAALGVRLYF